MSEINTNKVIKKLAEQLVNLTIKEVKELVDCLKEEHGIEPTAQASIVPVTSTEEGTTEKPTEKTNFDVILTSVGPSKVKVIRAIKNKKGIGIKEAHALVTNLPQTIESGLPKEEAEKLQKELVEAGGEVKLA